MAVDSGQVVAVTAQEGDHITLSIPLVGFPEGFQLRPGDRVFLVSGEKGPEARPLVHARELPRAPERKGERLAAANQEFALQRATVFAESPDDRHVILTIPNDGGRPEEVFAVRSPNK